MPRGDVRTTSEAGDPLGGRPLYLFLDAITVRYRRAPVPVLDRLSLFVRSGEIAAVVGPAGNGKTTLLRYVGRRSDGEGRVFLGSDADESGRKPGLVRRSCRRSGCRGSDRSATGGPDRCC